ncbi:MAG: bifunctional diaminohydroxyphosphoribosylaminopyrimidine deaminase/5-amino-6-(5-phosphoribosylamino)uracil reductase RibD [Phycisphaerales bacterium]|nr:bifunctional diaminohydroxyphosphoribosylaminopyrimidine deaminase/5-amino-6-(5-phosphoribosylamino)uracil reductase RibD [Phycisphaerales bacterium]
MRPSADERWLAHAARLALRGHGGVEPNPMVGCIIVHPDGRLVSWGAHTRCGGPHAEAVALARAGESARGCTAFVTLEPCAHHGRTPPCTDALIHAGISRVVYAEPDPSLLAGGGARALREAGVRVDQVECTPCSEVTAPFLLRHREGRPWVIAKWAQTLDGRTATRGGDSKWISSARSRAMVNRERARVDAVMVGIGTVFADDPNLLPRCSSRRRIPRRVIVDPALATPMDAQVVRTARDGAVEIAATRDAISSLTPHARDFWMSSGVRLTPLSDVSESAARSSMRGLTHGSLGGLLCDLHLRGVSTVLCEGGASLLGALFDEDLIDDAWCFAAPLAVADSAGSPVASGLGRIQMVESLRFELLDIRRRGVDAMLLWRRRQRGSTTGGDTRVAAGSRTS